MHFDTLNLPGAPTSAPSAPTQAPASVPAPVSDASGVVPRYPRAAECLPTEPIRTQRYTLRFAANGQDLQAAQRLRYRVFNEELGEGLAASAATGRDEDEFDARCHHLLVIENSTDEVVGTYRLMTAQTARGERFYSDTEYHLDGLPASVLREGVEAGRACVAEEHRSGRVIRLLFAGLAQYLEHNQKRFLFGCCSVPTLDPIDAFALYRDLDAKGLVDPRPLAPRGTFAVGAPSLRPVATPREDGPAVAPPALMATYLKLGARVVSGPAFDHEFGVTDFLVVLDVESMDRRVYAILAGSPRGARA